MGDADEAEQSGNEGTMSDSKDIANGGDVNQERVAIYMRLMLAQQRIAEELARSGVADERFVEALAAADADAGAADDHDIFLAGLSRYVKALGGYVEVRAVFPQAIVTVSRGVEPPPTDALDADAAAEEDLQQ